MMIIIQNLKLRPSKGTRIIFWLYLQAWRLRHQSSIHRGLGISLAPIGLNSNRLMTDLQIFAAI